ncbi:MAG: vWA domain-containing protein [Nitrosopumilaceae archaeon]
MKKTLFDISNNVFYEISKSNINEINFRSSDKIEFPIIEKTPKCRVTIPKPKKINQYYYFEGFVFEDYENDYEIIWSLYLATVCHMAVHAKISDYTKYEKWMESKTLEKCQKVIDFVEDLRVEEYLKKFFPDVWKNVSLIKKELQGAHDKTKSKYSKKFHDSVSAKKSKKVQELRKKLSQNEDVRIKEIVGYLDFLYKNQDLLPEINLPYCMHRDDGFIHKHIHDLKIKPKGKFARTISDLDDVWIKQTRSAKSLSDHQEMSKNTHFDEVVVGSEDLGEFVRLSDESEGILKKIRTTARIITNIIDTPSTEDAGLVNMQFAIQREASKNKGIQFFEQDLPRKEHENWLVIIDASASMLPRFEKMKKAALFFSEAAEEINQGDGKWGLYGFNNNFLVVKDHVEKFDNQTKARIGGIENKGFSLIPDAIDMGVKILNKDKQATRKHLILISDGRPFGYDNIDECFKKSLKNAKQNRINMIGVGIPKKLSKYFSVVLDGENPEESIEKFLRNYTSVLETMR